LTPPPAKPDHFHADIYKQAGFAISHFKTDAESADYSACTFKLNHLKIIFRKAKTTPTKTGQFVTVWKRSSAGPIAPFDVVDDFDFIIIASQMEERSGHFIFPKRALLEQGVISRSGKGGKRGIRVYPPDEIVNNKTAEKTQLWQQHFFIDLLHREPTVSTRLQELLRR
jgi:hypothetical protein